MPLCHPLFRNEKSTIIVSHPHGFVNSGAVFDNYVPMSENTTTEISKSTAICGAFAWWTGVDSNHRKRSWQIYSLLPLATREPVHGPSFYNATGAFFKIGLPPKAGSPVHAWSWRWELNPQPTDYKSVALPLSYSSSCFWCLEAESNHRHGDFQSPALPTELSRLIKWRPGRESNPRPLA